MKKNWIQKYKKEYPLDFFDEIKDIGIYIMDGYYLNFVAINPAYRKKGLLKTVLKKIMEQEMNDGTTYICSCADFLVPTLKTLGWEEIPEEEEWDGYVNYWTDEGDQGFCLPTGMQWNIERERYEELVPMKYVYKKLGDD